ncbi:MAG: hypothetical protein F4Y22_00645 [Gammaproteobacteria bacterium]|nr:hypothetical protein [Gammaproteobacteria bacterium]MYA65788.1 hypothetical protein [Gammaproteobacteria bacterium]MYH47189.1 hypothetical protein [Gammaproteobacteria bacterium]MYL12544.1 hypothetical protein [Gammaproteobacteria bacterium]
MLITNVADSANSCSLAFLFDQLDAGDFGTHDRLLPAGAGGEIDLPAGAHVSIVSEDGQALALDSATLECAEPVVARVLISLSVGETVQAAGTLPSVETSEKFGFPVLSDAFGDYFLVAYNQESSDSDCRIELATETGAAAGEWSFSVPGRETLIRTLAELVRRPADFGGGSANVSCDRAVAATGLLVGSALSGLPPVVLSRSSAPPTNTPPEADACIEINDVIELGEGESCAISQALVDKYRLNSVSVDVGDTASCSGGRVTLGFLSAFSIQLNGLTIRCR